MPTVSVIVAAYNAERWIAEALQSLVVQTHPDYEVIVVDDGSRDSTAEIAATFPVTVVRTAHRGLGAARAYGVSVATGQVFVFIDADDVYAEDFVEHMVAPLSDPAVRGTFPGGFSWLNPNEGLAWGWLYVRGRRPGIPVTFGQHNPWPKAMRREDLARIGGYPQVGYGEDRVLGHLTGPALVVHSARFWYRLPTTSREILLRSRWVGRGPFFSTNRPPLHKWLPPISWVEALRYLRARRGRAAWVKVLHDAGRVWGFIEGRLAPVLRDRA